MKESLRELIEELSKLAVPEKADFFPRFFKSGPGEYGEGDKFLGITVPNCRYIAKKYEPKFDISDIGELLKSSWHEERLTALLILVIKYSKADFDKKSEIFDFYLKNTKHINNWDLVDLSCTKIIGDYIHHNPSKQKVLDRLINSNFLWDKRIAIVSTLFFIVNGNPEPTLRIVEKSITDDHDLIQKANGWMLRELGKRIDSGLLVNFLEKHYQEMPRITLRYAIEKFSPELRQKYLRGIFGKR